MPECKIMDVPCHHLRRPARQAGRRTCGFAQTNSSEAGAATSGSATNRQSDSAAPMVPSRRPPSRLQPAVGIPCLVRRTQRERVRDDKQIQFAEHDLQ